ncbi:MAG: methyltransferase domain-containing protein [Fodinibius sp.]|nr:methyltransferase domain-containing protein [Fodinibius sp.]MDZ7659762.1 methyltransferase domain-containing protein [Fodinibius sp.]
MISFSLNKFAKHGCLIFLVLLATTSLSCAQAPGNQSDVDWLIEVLEIESGSTVADIGAGDGDQTRAIAQHIGSEGTIYSTELGKESVEELKQSVANTDLSNITVLEGHPERTNLPEQCCEALFLRRVYHHITNPDAFNSSLFASLKPGGRLAIIDFKPRESEAEPGGRASGSQHGVTAKTVIEELKHAGFSLISSEEGTGRDIYVVMQKPLSDF